MSEDSGELNDEVKEQRVKRKPGQPTTQDMFHHHPLDLQYRCWCAHCVAGRATTEQHIAQDPGRERLGSKWHVDSFNQRGGRKGMPGCLFCLSGEMHPDDGCGCQGSHSSVREMDVRPYGRIWVQRRGADRQHRSGSGKHFVE